MLKKLINVLLLCAAVALSAGAKEISISDFGAIPNDGENDREAFIKAADYCRKKPGTVLVIPAGVYNISDALAQKIEREAISGAYGENVQGTLFHPGAPYVKAFDLSKCKNVTVKAAGAKLLLDGWYEVVTLNNCKNVAVEGLEIEYHRPPNTVGRVVNSTPESFEIEFDPERYCFIDSIVTGRVHFYDHVRNLVYTGGGWNKTLEAPNKIKMTTNTHIPVGDYCILRHGGHYRPAVMIRESKGVTLTNMKIHSQPGMGVVGHLSSDIVLDGVQVLPLAGDVISTNTDATHFTSCSGDLVIKNCRFRGQGDDCTNVHNYYYGIYPKGENKAEIKIENADLHAQWIDYPVVGDSMVIIDRRNMEQLGRYAVTSVDTSITYWEVNVTLNKPLPAELHENAVMTNISRFPKVKIIDNAVGSHLARAFLVKAPEVYIARNYITGSCNAAIKLGAELSWNEAGPVSNVLIEDNYISGCGHSANPHAPSGVMLSTEASQTPPQVNRNITIRNNVFDSDKPLVILLKDASNVLVENNSVNQKDYVKIDNCSNVSIK